MKLKKSLLMTAVFISSLAYARPPASFDFVYYADDTYTTQVGNGWFTCAGRTTTFGQVTEFQVISNEQSCY